MRISGLVEGIFSTAVAMSQDGGQRNTIYAVDKEIFILNYDHTLLLRFRLRDTEAPFHQPVGFSANDYDSNEFEERDGKIVFLTTQNGFTRKKTCGRPGTSPEEVRELYLRYTEGATGEEVVLQRPILDLLDRELSHVEFSGEAGKTLHLVQRNIYDGTLIEIDQKQDGLLTAPLKNDFGPVAIKTNDFTALFNFQDALRFIFPLREKEDYIIAFSLDRNRRDVTAIIAACLYDELIAIKESKRL